MEKKRISFGYVYLLYVSVLILIMLICLGHVRELLQRYEAFRPECKVEDAIATLLEDAEKEDFGDKYDMSKNTVSVWEEHIDLESEYLALYQEDMISYSKKIGLYEEDELYYIVKNGDRELAEIKLKAKGPAQTMLAVLSYREWQLEYIRPYMKKNDYTLTVPNDFEVTVNGIQLVNGDYEEREEITYQLQGLYYVPQIEIRDAEGNHVNYRIYNQYIDVEYYSYRLTLPSALTVKLNGEVCSGELLEGKRTSYDINTLTKPDIEIWDDYGNCVEYEGEKDLPLTYMTITADSRYHITVYGKAIPPEAITEYENPEYSLLTEEVENLPCIRTYDIAVLDAKAEICVSDENGIPVSLDENTTTYEFLSDVGREKSIPNEISAKVDVLEIAKTWSLFLTKDASYKEIAQYLMPDTYQYEVVKKYANSVDINLTSSHRLLDPAFTDEMVTNFTWITDDCFSVDVSFVKHMILSTKKKVDDSMNDRFYYKKYATDGAEESWEWKIVGMKEIVDNAE